MADNDTTRLTRITLVALAVAVVGLGAADTPAAAQDTDDRWLAWMGCWQPVRQSDSPAAPGAMICFQPISGDTGIEMVSLEEGEIVERQTIRADGTRHEASAEGCSGWERGDFSTQAGRVYLSSEYECEGDVSRASTGMMTLLSSEQWIDVRGVTINDQTSTWVTKYRLATQTAAENAGFGDIASDRGMAVRSARVAASGRPSVDEVIEASDYVDADVVQAWLIERDLPLTLDSDRLVRMADAGVPEATIDVAIAVSYPDRFSVGSEAAQYAGSYGGAYGGRGVYFDPFYGAMFGFSPFGYGYSPYGYGYGYGGYGRYYGTPIISIDRRDSGGRVINGQGYRRGGSSGTSVRAPTSRGTSSVGTSSVGRSRGAAGGRSTGRTARRRGGGGS